MGVALFLSDPCDQQESLFFWVQIVPPLQAANKRAGEQKLQDKIEKQRAGEKSDAGYEIPLLRNVLI